jgi:hypothetical protein
MSNAATNTNLDSGINIGTQFKFWYEARISTPNAPNNNGYVPYKWPPGVLDMEPLFDTPSNPNGTPGPSPPASPAWETLRLSNAGTFDPVDPNCSSNGVSIRAEDIGSDYPGDTTRIRSVGVNQFHANPHNQTPGQVNGIKARFRIANWGTNPNWEDVPNPTSTLWQDIANSNGVPQPNGISIAANTVGSITTPYELTTVCDRCRYKGFYDANPAACDAACGLNNPPTNKTRLSHQCLLVDLTGAGVTFISASAYQNMNYASTSSFSQVADINIKDLPGFAGGRDVYLYLQARNMPAHASPGTQGIGKLPIPGWPAPADVPRTPAGVPTSVGNEPTGEAGKVPVPHARADQAIAALTMAVATRQIDYGQLAESMPTLIVRAYYDTGVKNTAGGGSRPILKPLTSFGYFVVHDGEVEGWNYELEGAELIAPHWYKVAVPASGVAAVTTVIEAIEFLPFSVGLRAGVGVPHGSFGNTWDSGFAFEGDFEYRLNKMLAVQGVFGYDSFEGSPDDLTVTHISARAKAYAPGTNPRLAVFAGAGRYFFDPGDSHTGVSIGGVAEIRVTAQWSVEATYTLHFVSTPGQTSRFSAIQGGARYRF